MESSSKKGIFALKVIVFAIFGTAFFWQCANISSPQGGPKDTLPPSIMSAQPAFNTVNFDGKKIHILFDEYIQLKDQQKEFYTSPPMKKKPRLMARGKGFVIEIQDTLLENTTYALNFGNSVRDNNEGNPLNGFRYVFSTGDRIDSMFMSGYTVDAYKKDSISKTLVFFYDAKEEFDPQNDSTLFNKTPLAIGRAENNGIFIAHNLKPIDYRLYAFEDSNSNFTYDPGVDKVAFLDGEYNPLSLPDFNVKFDTTRSYMVADPQVYFRMFMDKQFKRQNLADKKRPSRHKIELYFNAPHPQIDSLILDSIAPEQIITEYVTKGRDTINLWLNVKADMLPDTIKGRIVYHKHDSINELVPHSEKLNLFWKYIESKEEIKAREKLEKERQKALEDSVEFKEPVKPNPFGYRLDANKDFNPENNISIDFDYPIVEMDSTLISLIRVESEEKKFRVRYVLDRDSTNMRKWIISAPWSVGENYKLEIPAGVFRDVASQTNDTIKADFTVLSPDKFSSIKVALSGKNTDSNYILQLLDNNNRILQEKKFAVTGTYSFNYINPGEVKLRIIEDMNKNGKWDSGELLTRREPERVELYIPESGDELISLKAGWESEISLDMKEIFKPIDIMDIRKQIEKSEVLRHRKWLEEREKKRQQEEERKKGGSQGGRNTGGGGTVGGGMKRGNTGGNLRM